MAYLGQELLELAPATGGLDEQEYLDARAACLRRARDEGIDAATREHRWTPSWPPPRRRPETVA